MLGSASIVPWRGLVLTFTCFDTPYTDASLTDLDCNAVANVSQQHQTTLQVF